MTDHKGHTLFCIPYIIGPPKPGQLWELVHLVVSDNNIKQTKLLASLLSGVLSQSFLASAWIFSSPSRWLKQNCPYTTAHMFRGRRSKEIMNMCCPYLPTWRQIPIYSMSQNCVISFLTSYTQEKYNHHNWIVPSKGDLLSLENHLRLWRYMQDKDGYHKETSTLHLS